MRKILLIILFSFVLSACAHTNKNVLKLQLIELPNFNIIEKTNYPNSPFNELVNNAYSHEAPILDYYENQIHYATLLNVGDESLLARIHLIRIAQKSINIQTYIWKTDESSRYVIKELIDAANRGVKVKIIIDQVGSRRNVDLMAYLASAHQNLEVKFYNPSADRVDPNNIHIASNVFTDVKDYNQRMHNKTVIIDDQIVITGGRNFENDYYDRNRTLNFKDRDIIVVGPIVKEFTRSFVKYWVYENSIYAKDLVDVGKVIKEGKYKEIITPDSFNFDDFFENIDKLAMDYNHIKEKFINTAFKVNKIKFIVDEPGKNTSRWVKGGGRSTKQIGEILSLAQKSIVAQSPYLVLDRPTYRFVSRKIKNTPSLDIKISTNSLASTDSIYAYSFAFKKRKDLVKRLHFRIFELKPIPKDIKRIMPNYGEKPDNYYPEKPENLIKNPLPFTQIPIDLAKKPLEAITKPLNGVIEKPLKTLEKPIDAVGELIKDVTFIKKKRYVSIHAKSFVVDDEIAYVGSFNIDPRSVHLNTEIGVVIWDKDFAKALGDDMLADMSPGNSWTVGKKQDVPVISTVSGIITFFAEHTPIVHDLWPFQYATLFELQKEKEELPFYHKDFYKNYKDVGQFPQVGISKRPIQIIIIKALGGWAEPAI